MSSHSLDVIVSAQAQEDFEDILLHSERSWEVEQADAYQAAVDAALRSLSGFPRLGRMRDDIFDGCRSLSVERHVIYYEVGEDSVTILRILHARMDATGHFRR